MTQRFFVDESGVYLGSWDVPDNVNRVFNDDGEIIKETFTPFSPSENAIEITSPPDHASQIWDGKKWNPVIE